jgi:hypothetical protein
MVDLGDLIHVYDNALDADTCDFLIATFDGASENHEIVKSDGKPNFTQFNLTENSSSTDELKKTHKHISREFNTIVMFIMSLLILVFFLQNTHLNNLE